MTTSRQKLTFCTASAMSVLGQKRIRALQHYGHGLKDRFALQSVMSALPPKADIDRVNLDVG